MTDPVKDFLSSLWEMRLEADRLRERTRELYDATQRITGNYESIHVSGTPETGKLLTLYADSAAREERRQAECLAREKEIEEFLDRMEGGPRGIYRTILRLRYISCLSWPRIQAILQAGEGDTDYSDRHIYRFHGEALNAARRLWAAEHNTGGDNNE